MTKQTIHACRSCNFTFSSGRGGNGNRFCSERCQDYFDAGHNLASAGVKGRGEYRVVASPNKDAIGEPLSVYKDTPPFVATDIVKYLNVPASALSVSGFTGKRGKIAYRSPGRWEIVAPGGDRWEIRRLDCVSVTDGKLILNRLPDETEAATICRLIGLRRSPRWNSEFRMTLDNKTSPEIMREVPV